MSSYRMGNVHRRSIDEVAIRFYECLDSAISLSCAIKLRYRDYASLVSSSVNPKNYIDAYRFFIDYQAVSFLSKNPFLKTGIDKSGTAFDKFLLTEFRCHDTNVLFDDISKGKTSPLFSHVDFNSKFRGKIASILGEIPFSFENIDLRFGPGATFKVRGNTDPRRKLSEGFDCTSGMLHYLPHLFAEVPGWITDDIVDVTVVPGNALAFVPKTAKTDRVIFCEPTLNGMVQLGIGSYLKKRLLRYGIDLSNQSINQRLASIAQFSNLATLDLSNASDTISYNLVRDSLPINWVFLFDFCRSPSYEHSGEIFNFSKWSSMGNGYTFELETVIFLAACLATLECHGVDYTIGYDHISPERSLNVYGDDIIVPNCIYDDLVKNINTLGFEVNLKKSFFNGSFYESCGHDYFCGRQVRPFFFKRNGLSQLEDFFHTHNSLKEVLNKLKDLSNEGRQFCLCDDHRSSIITRFDGLLDWYVRSVPKYLRFRVPHPFIEAGFYASFEECSPTRHRWWDGFTFRGLIIRERADKVEDTMPFALYSAYSCATKESRVSGYSNRRGHKTRRVTTFFSHLWSDRPER